MNAPALTFLVAGIAALTVVWSAHRNRKAKNLRSLLSHVVPSQADVAREGGWQQRKRKQKQALQTEDIGALCTEVAARLRAGTTPQAAWAAALGRYGPTGLSAQGGSPQQSELALVEEHLLAAGTVGETVVTGMAFSAQTGAPLAGILDRLAASVADGQRTQDAVAVAFAGPKASARVLTLLPLVGLFGAELLGASPFLWFGSGLPQLLLGLTGLTLTFLGYRVSRRMIQSALELAGQLNLAPVLCDLAAAGTSGGLSVPTTLQALGVAADLEGLVQVGMELRLGAEWDEAWQDAPPSGDLLKVAFEPAWTDGVSPLTLLHAVAEQARGASVTRARSQAEKLGVKLAFPLGVLLLPAFIILGLVPVFFSLVAGQVAGFLG